VNRKQALAYARDILANRSIDDASLEGEILLRHVLGLDRARLYSDLDTDLTPAQEETLKKYLERRRRGEPSAYITGHREFYGLDFHIDCNVIIPRPESELLVAKAISLARNKPAMVVADIGTGCGAIAISLAVNLPSATVYATDVSPPAIEIARVNCRKHGVTGRVILLEGNMLEPLPGPVDLIIANLPYVRESDLSRSGPLSFEPALALDGGTDGLDRIRVLCRQAGNKLRSGGCLLLEIGQGQAGTVTALLQETFPLAMIEVERDLAGIERVVSLRLTRH
jgi:release factor glutamine methyltransferase